MPDHGICDKRQAFQMAFLDAFAQTLQAHKAALQAMLRAHRCDEATECEACDMAEAVLVGHPAGGDRGEKTR